MKEDRLLTLMFEPRMWEEMIKKANEKGINLSVLRRLSNPEELKRLYVAIATEQYEISPPHIVLIPKDKPGEFRECKANEDVDRIVLTLINDCLNELFPQFIHKNSKAYQKGTGSVEVTRKSVDKIMAIKDRCEGNKIGYKCDLSKYFDSVSIKWIDCIFDMVEDALGFARNTETVMNMLRKYYHSDWLFDVDGNLIQKYTSLKQGSAVASYLANTILYSVDERMTEMCNFYVRYSDDILLIGENAEEALNVLEIMLSMYGLKLNPNKVEELTKDKWFKFLGFNIKGDLITLSKNRIKKWQKEVEKITLKSTQPYEVIKRNFTHHFYEGDYNWATSCFSIINCQSDIDEMNKFAMDCLKACEVRDIKVKAKAERMGTKVKRYPIGINKIGGLGVVTDLEDRTIIRGKGKSVATNRNKTDKDVGKYVSIGCLVKNYQQSRYLFEATVRGIQ